MNKFLKFRLIKKRLQAAALKSAKPLASEKPPSFPASGSRRPMASLPALGSLSRGLEVNTAALDLLPDRAFVPSALPCPLRSGGGLDIGAISPVCDRLSRKEKIPKSPAPRFPTFKAFWVWRPGLGIMPFSNLSRYLSCTLSTSYTNLHCMSCKIQGGARE